MGHDQQPAWLIGLFLLALGGLVAGIALALLPGTALPGLVVAGIATLIIVIGLAASRRTGRR